ncbi:MAG TPA: hypothetical protein VGF77_08295 [Allosphingosinicella sp.]|jgi:hypothetical protein
MLRTPTSFPNVGSWALLVEAGQTLAVRITGIDPGNPDWVTVSIAGAYTASGTRRLSRTALLNADALSAEERAELDAIDARMAGKARPKKADVDRAKALADRHNRARVLQALLEKQPEKYFPAAATAARERAGASA